MGQLINVGPFEALRPGAENGRDQSLVAVRAHNHRLPFELSDLHDALLADDLHARIVPVPTWAHARDETQAAVLELQVDQDVVLEVLGLDMVGCTLEVSHLGVNAFMVGAHQPACRVPIVAVDFRQHAIG